MTWLAQTIPSIPLGNLGPWGVIGIIVLLVLTGRLVPRSVIDEKNETIRYWRDAFENERKARSVWAEHTSKLMDGQELIVDVVRSIRSAVGGERPSQ